MCPLLGVPVNIVNLVNLVLKFWTLGDIYLLQHVTLSVTHVTLSVTLDALSFERIKRGFVSAVFAD